MFSRISKSIGGGAFETQSIAHLQPSASEEFEPHPVHTSVSNCNHFCRLARDKSEIWCCIDFIFTDASSNVFDVFVVCEAAVPSEDPLSVKLGEKRKADSDAGWWYFPLSTLSCAHRSTYWQHVASKQHRKRSKWRQMHRLPPQAALLRQSRLSPSQRVSRAFDLHSCITGPLNSLGSRPDSGMYCLCGCTCCCGIPVRAHLLLCGVCKCAEQVSRLRYYFQAKVTAFSPPEWESAEGGSQSQSYHELPITARGCE